MIRLIILCLLLTGCMTVEKAEKVMRAHPKELAELCLDCFGDKKEPIYIKGDTVTLLDTITSIETDTVKVNADCPDGTKIVVDCPPNKTIYKTKHTHSTDSVFRDTWQTLAKLKILEVDNSKLVKERDEAIKSRDGWRNASLWGWGIIGASLLVWAIRKRLP